MFRKIFLNIDSGYTPRASLGEQIRIGFASRICLGLALSLAVLSLPVSLIQAREPMHQDSLQNQFTLIINQVRGSDRCDPGSLANFQHQLEKSSQLQLSATWVLRYDTLINSDYLSVFNSYQQRPRIQFGGLLEVTPSWAGAADVEYTATEDNWYRAQHAFLVGYTLEERQRLIDAYMQKFQHVFGFYPQLTTAWMIDAWSLNYLRQEYGVKVHQITREQIGTDSYTLYGGPVHYPYWPADNWALVPADSVNLDMPLIVRQTISDPVYNYGDQSNSYTSQPNDYLLRQADLSYFEHLFLQAQRQLTDFGWAVIGLETSMVPTILEEYDRQLSFVADWREQGGRVLTPAEFENWYRDHYSPLWLYAGQSQSLPTERAWWITSPNYRARIRLSNQELFISDLRVYDANFTDPYLNQPAQMLGWWIMPFVLDGSRLVSAASPTDHLFVRNDYLLNREQGKYGAPSRIRMGKVEAEQLEIATQPSLEMSGKKRVEFWNGATLTAVFSQDDLCLNTDNYELNQFGSAPLQQLNWMDQDNALWSLEQISSSSVLPDSYYSDLASPAVDSDMICFKPVVSKTDLSSVRQKYSQLLFPELQLDQLDPSQTELYINNQYALAGRNPIRLVIFPRNQQAKPVLPRTTPGILVKSDQISTTVEAPDPINGMIFIDLNAQRPLTTTVTVSLGEFKDQTQVYFTPNCRQQPLYCLTHPRQAWWFVQSWLGDRQRVQQEQAAQQQQFVD